MNLFPEHINLNGKSFLIKELLENYSAKYLWEKESLDFLKDWYSPQKKIEVNTSGSTGTPKLIELEKSFVAESALRTVDFFCLKKGDRILHCLPSRFIAGKLMIVRGLIGKLDLHLVDPASNFKLLDKEKFKFAAMVPNQVIKILHSNFRLSNIESLLIGGAAVPNILEKELQNQATKYYSSYGMTETATHIALRKLNGKDTDSFYHCLGGIKVQLSESSCLQIKMPGLSKPIQTTDLAQLKSDTSFQILGRADHIIISGGIKYSPEVIEKKLEAHIKQVFMVSSNSHPKLGRQIVLIVEGLNSIELEKEILAICQNHLSKFECPRQISFMDQLPRTKNGKLIRK